MLYICNSQCGVALQCVEVTALCSSCNSKNEIGIILNKPEC